MRPRRLSRLLAEAEEISPAAAALLLHRAVHAFSPQIGQHVDRGDPHALIAVRTGDEFDTPRFGGDDLLLQIALLGLPDDADSHDTDGLADEENPS